MEGAQTDGEPIVVGDQPFDLDGCSPQELRVINPHLFAELARRCVGRSTLCCP